MRGGIINSSTKIVATLTIVFLAIACVYIASSTDDNDNQNPDVDVRPGGTVSGGGDIDVGKTVTLTAEPQYGYQFAGWYDGYNMVSSSPTYTFTATDDNRPTAKFDPIPFSVSITSNYDGGDEYGSGSYLYGSSATLSASVKAGYAFDGWYDDGKKISPNTYAKYKVEKDSVVSAEYSIIHDSSFNVTKSSSKAPATLTATSKYNVEILSQSWTVRDDITGATLPCSYHPDYKTMKASVDTGRALSVTHTVVYSDGAVHKSTKEVVVDQTVTNAYSWKYQKDSWYSILTESFLNNAGANWNISMSFSWYYGYLSDDIPRGSPFAYGYIQDYVTETDPVIRGMAQGLKNFTSDMNDLQRVNCVLKFVQSIEYQYDSDGKGRADYWKYPAETLWEMKGDCEDHALLFASLIKAMGYKVVILDLPGHLAAAVKVDGASGTYVTYGGEKYYYCEATADSGTGKMNWANVGYMSSEYTIKRVYAA